MFRKSDKDLLVTTKACRRRSGDNEMNDARWERGPLAKAVAGRRIGCPPVNAKPSTRSGKNLAGMTELHRFETHPHSPFRVPRVSGFGDFPQNFGLFRPGEGTRRLFAQLGHSGSNQVLLCCSYARKSQGNTVFGQSFPLQLSPFK